MFLGPLQSHDQIKNNSFYSENFPLKQTARKKRHDHDFKWKLWLEDMGEATYNCVGSIVKKKRPKYIYQQFLDF